MVALKFTGLTCLCCLGLAWAVTVVEDDSDTLLQLPEHDHHVHHRHGHHHKHRRGHRSHVGLWPAMSHVSHMKMSPSFLQVMSSTGFKLDTVKLNLQRRGAPWKDRTQRPLTSCRNDNASTVKDANLREAVMKYCEADMGSLTEFFVDPRFQSAFDRLSDEHNWIPEAFVTYVELKPGDNQKAQAVAEQVTLLSRSVHHFSTRPIVVANTGNFVPKEWDPERFPRMILMHARPLPRHMMFNFNKIRALLFTKVSTGIIVDADQFINNGVDDMFHRAREEITRKYPYPILPVHWMSRDPEAGEEEPYHVYNWTFRQADRFAKDLPRRSMRWNHAHPTWTHHALPFVAKWSVWELSPEVSQAPDWLAAQGALEDEDMFNVALWSVNATKQWCKFDTSSADDFNMFLKQETPMKVMWDPKWYPKGIPIVFYTAHDVKNVTQGTEVLEKLWTDTSEVQSPHILYDGQWFNSGTELKKYDPSLRCII